VRISLKEFSKNPQFMRILPLIVLFLLAMLLATGLFNSSDDKPKESRVIGLNVADFTIPTLDGKATISPKNWLGKIVVVNIFASWCEPCAVEHPVLMRLAKTGKVEVVGIAWKDKPENTAGFLKKYGVPFHQIGSDANGDTTFAFALTGVPETYIIDKEGKIAYNYKAPITDEMVDTIILPMVDFLRKQNVTPDPES
jgi:cytochrome c biogenesis protein CcmG/thiol:disulfide interchange protein DsbE